MIDADRDPTQKLGSARSIRELGTSLPVSRFNADPHLDEHWKQVEAIATALQTEGYLAGAEIDRLMGAAATQGTPNSEGRR